MTGGTLQKSEQVGGPSSGALAACPPDILAQVQQACGVLARHLAEGLRGIHLFGSAVDGGLHPHSDIDLLATVDAPLPEATRRALMAELLTVSQEPSASGPWRPLEVTVVVRSEVVPWRHPARRELQFGEWLRADLQAGVVEPPMLDHDLAILLTKAQQHSIALMGPPVVQLLDPVPREDMRQALADTIAQWNQPEDWQGDERNVVLALARIWYSAGTGLITSKDAAAAWALERLPAPWRPALDHARAAYLGLAEDTLHQHPQAVADFVHHAKAVITRILQAPPRAHPAATA